MQVRYRDGNLNGYASRLHYFSDWIRNNEQMGFVMECTSETACDQPKELWLDFMTTHVESYQPMTKNQSLIAEIASVEKKWQGCSITPYGDVTVGRDHERFCRASGKARTQGNFRGILC